jgi:hypothetical protein
MRNRFIKICIALLCNYLLQVVVVSAQPVVLPFHEAEKQGYKFNVLDSLYRDAINVDSTKAVFRTKANEDANYQAWVKLIQSFSSYLYKNGWTTENDVRGFIKVYFAPSGKVEMFFYNMKDASISEEQHRLFKKLIAEMLTDYNYGMQADEQFSQCGQILLKAPK